MFITFQLGELYQIPQSELHNPIGMFCKIATNQYNFFNIKTGTPEFHDYLNGIYLENGIVRIQSHNQIIHLIENVPIAEREKYI